MTKTGIDEFYTLQDKSSFVMNRMRQFSDLLSKYLPDVAEILNRFRIEPLFYSLRWFSLLFAQEHELAALLNIWDVLWSHFSELRDFVSYIALAHIEAVKGRLSASNYAVTLKALQHLEIGPDVRGILECSRRFWANRDKK
jgi:hypothetical protein